MSLRFDVRFTQCLSYHVEHPSDHLLEQSLARIFRQGLKNSLSVRSLEVKIPRQVNEVNEEDDNDHALEVHQKLGFF